MIIGTEKLQSSLERSRESMRKKVSSFILAVVLMAALITGCSSAPETKTLYQSDTVRVERTGSQTVIYDLVGGAEYSFTSHRARVKKEQTTEELLQMWTAKTTADTETVKLQTVQGLIILEDKTAAKTYYIK